MAYGRVIEPAQGFGLAQEPSAAGLLRVKVYSETYPALQDLVVSFEEYLLGGGRYCPFQAVPGSERIMGALEVVERLDAGQRSSPRRRSIVTSRPQTATLHQRRL